MVLGVQGAKGYCSTLSFFVPFRLRTDVPRRKLSPRAADSKRDLWEEEEKAKALVVSPKCAGTGLRGPLPHRDGDMVVLAAPCGFRVVSGTFPGPPSSSPTRNHHRDLCTSPPSRTSKFRLARSKSIPLLGDSFSWSQTQLRPLLWPPSLQCLLLKSVPTQLSEPSF